MHSLVGFMRGAVGFAVGMVAGMFVLAIGRQLAFGDGLGPTPTDVSLMAQIGVAATWFLGAGVAVWVALRVSRRHLVGMLATAWLFQMAWLSPGVRPVVFEMRAVASLLAAIGGFGMYLLWRARHEQSSQMADGQRTA